MKEDNTREFVGSVQLYRKLAQSELWLAESFTKGQAWADLIMLARFSDGFITVQGMQIEVKRGDVGWSELSLVKRWKWSRNKVRAFLKRLVSENMLNQKRYKRKDKRKNILSIVNYNQYQYGKKEKKQAKGTSKGTVKKKENKGDANSCPEGTRSKAVEWKLETTEQINERQQLQPTYSEIADSTESQVPKRRTNGELEDTATSNKDSSSPSKKLSIADCKELTQGLAPVPQIPIEEPHPVPWDNLPGIQGQPLRIDSGHATYCKEEQPPDHNIDCRSFLEQAKDSPSRYPKPTGDFDEEEFKRNFGKNGEMELMEFDGLSSFDMATARRRGRKVKQVPCDEKKEVFGQHETEVLLDPASGIELPIY